MQNPNLIKWSKDPELEGLLFFAQSINDMLFDYTLDTYKVPALNTHFRCIEGLVFIDMVERGIIYPKALDQTINEFLWSFKNDPIIKSLFGPKIGGYIREVEKRKNKSEELENILNLIADLLSSNYIEEAKKQLISIICQEPKQKDLIYSLTRSFLTELIYAGYSKGFIFYKTKQFFFDPAAQPEITSQQQINEYLNNFNLEKKKFDLIFKANENFDYIKDSLKELNIEASHNTPEIRTEKRSEKEFLEEKNEEYPCIIEFKEIEAFDAQSARDGAEEIIRSLASLLKYNIHERDFSWQNEVLTYELPQNYPLVVKPTVKAVHKRPDKELEEIPEAVKNIIDLIYKGNLDYGSRELIFGALKLHSEAICAKTEENQLLTFWSFIEGILPPPGDVGRIDYILRSIEPLIVVDYPKKLIFDMQKNLETCGGAEVKKIIEKVEEGNNTFEKCAAIISIKENETYRDEIYSLIENNVLLRNRLYTLMKKLNSAKSIASTIEEHRQRVAWHVQRIYRMRNMIAHSTERFPPYYIGTLIENLHSYVDRILDLLLTTSIKNPDIKTIDEIILKISMDVNVHRDTLKTHENDVCTPETYMLFLLGPE